MRTLVLACRKLKLCALLFAAGVTAMEGTFERCEEGVRKRPSVRVLGSRILGTGPRRSASDKAASSWVRWAARGVVVVSVE